jgi:hypothetical protein
MRESLEQYNDGVYERQAEHGRLATAEAPGSQLRRGEWKELV